MRNVTRIRTFEIKMSLMQIAYVSESRLPQDHVESSTELQRIFETAQRYNTAHDITGYFVFDGVYFAQILEGSPASVRGTALRISGDRRHSNVRMLGERSVIRREFGQWVMGFSDLRALHLDGGGKQHFDDVKACLLEAARRSLVA
jgi:hypothetical protein